MNFDFSEIVKNLGGIKKQIENIHERLDNMQITGEAGAGMVRVTLNGDNVVKNISIDPNLLVKEEKDVLEELLISAFNEARKKVRAAAAHEMKNITGGISIPGLERFFGL